MIKVNEFFGPTVQGEGKNIGKPVMFLRLAQCNLHCIWCDTPFTWNWEGTKFEHPDKYPKHNEIHLMSALDIVLGLYFKGGKKIKHLVISGGEPLLQQKRLVDLCWMLKDDDWFIEIETNGTVTPINALIKLVDQFNVSPKLSSAQDPYHKRFKPKALNKLVETGIANFKFVVSKKDDLAEVEAFLMILNDCGETDVYLMPLCSTQEELNANGPIVEALAKEYGYLYTSRLSIEKSGITRGV